MFMDPADAANFFGIVLIGGAIALTAMTASRATRPTIIDAAPKLAALVAIGATLGSLYFSERAGFVPCELCWYQRIAMYPLAVVLAIAAVRDDRAISRYALPLAAAGLGIAGYHIQVQLFPEQASFCEAANPCSGRWVEAFGWMTIPQMAALSFALVIALLLIARMPTTAEES